MKPFVLDASVSAAWCFVDEATSFTEQLFNALIQGTSAIVPVIWRHELANVLLLAARKQRTTNAAIEIFLSKLAQFDILIDSLSLDKTFRETRLLAEQHGLTVYDAAYLEVAQRRSLPLATFDKALQRAAAAAGVGLLAP